MTTPTLSEYFPGTLSGGVNAYVNGFLAADLNGLAAGSAVMSSVVFDPTAAPDLFADLSFTGVLAAATAIAAGNNIGLAIAYLQDDGTTYGDGRLTAGTALAGYVPVVNVIAGFAFAINAATATVFASDVGLIALRPSKFRLIAVNNMPGALAAAGNMISLKSYKLINNAAS